MLYSSAALALLAILPALASPVQKRYDGVKIRAGRSNNLCLSTTPKDGPADGTQLFLRGCNNGDVSTWNISPGSGSVILANAGVPGKTFALDAGVPQVNNARAKIWTSYPGSAQQTWYLTDDNRIAITGGNQCLDLETGTDLPQTYECSTGNNNQVWYIDGISSPPTTSAPNPTTSAAPSTVSSASSPYGSSNPFPSDFTVRWKADINKCLTVNGPRSQGSPINFQICGNNPSLQGFFFNSNGAINLVGTSLCLDAGSNPANGGDLKLWTCGGYPQQTWYTTSDGLIGTVDSQQCIDVKSEDPSQAQTWACSSTDKQQLFIHA